jgi:hypothetical protein
MITLISVFLFPSSFRLMGKGRFSALTQPWGKPIFATESKNEQRLINQFLVPFSRDFFFFGQKKIPFLASTCSAFHWRRRSLHFLVNKYTFNLSIFVFNINRKRWIFQELVIIKKVKGSGCKMLDEKKRNLSAGLFHQCWNFLSHNFFFPFEEFDKKKKVFSANWKNQMYFKNKNNFVFYIYLLLNL